MDTQITRYYGKLCNNFFKLGAASRGGLQSAKNGLKKAAFWTLRVKLDETRLFIDLNFRQDVSKTALPLLRQIWT